MNKIVSPFLVEADVAGIGRIKKWTTASSERQAIKQVALYLQKKYPHMRIFLANIRVAKALPKALPA